MEEVNNREIKMTFIGPKPLMFNVRCNRQDEDLIVKRFNAVGFVVPVRSPGNITFRYNESLWFVIKSFLFN